jgi:hypothetical protein
MLNLLIILVNGDSAFKGLSVISAPQFILFYIAIVKFTTLKITKNLFV